MGWRLTSWLGLKRINLKLVVVRSNSLKGYGLPWPEGPAATAEQPYQDQVFDRLREPVFFRQEAPWPLPRRYPQQLEKSLERREARESLEGELGFIRPMSDPHRSACRPTLWRNS